MARFEYEAGFVQVVLQGRIQDSTKGGCFVMNARKAREIFEATPTFYVDHAHFRSQTACSKSSVAFDGR